MVDMLTVQPLPEIGPWPDTIPRIEAGWRFTGGSVDPANDGGLANWQARDLAIRTSILKERIDLMGLSVPTLTTVGPGGDYATINAALAALSVRRPAYTLGGFTTEVRLLQGYQMQEQVLINGINLGWITLTSEATEVVIVRGALGEQYGSCYPAFAASNGGSLPAIGALFSMDGTGQAALRNGLYVHTTGSATILSGKGFKNCGANAVAAETAGRVSANGAILTGAGSNGISAAGGTSVTALGANTSNAGSTGIAAANGAVVHAEDVISTGCNINGMSAVRGAVINAANSNARRNGPTGANSTADFVISQGGTIVAIGALGGIQGGVTANTISAAGIIYQ